MIQACRVFMLPLRLPSFNETLNDSHFLFNFGLESCQPRDKSLSSTNRKRWFIDD